MKNKETLAMLRAKLAAESKMHEREETSLRLKLAQQKDEHDKELAKCAAECQSHKARAENWEREAKRLANNEAEVRRKALGYIKQLRYQKEALVYALTQEYRRPGVIGIDGGMKDYEDELTLERWSLADSQTTGSKAWTHPDGGKIEVRYANEWKVDE